jgi:hypothetical protein
LVGWGAGEQGDFFIRTTFGLLQAQADGHGVARGPRLRAKSVVGQNCGPKRKVEHR